MFSSKVSSRGLARCIESTIPHTAPADGVRPAYRLTGMKKFQKITTPVMAARGLVSSGLSATVQHFGHTQVRFAHTDVSCPDFSAERRESCMDPHQPASRSKYQRKSFNYMATAAFAIPGLYSAKTYVKNYGKLFETDEFLKALSKIELNLSEIKPGFGVTTMYQGKPLFVRHRTPEEIEELNGVNMAELRDPAADVDRFENQKWTVLIGVCTHLGCVPISHAGNWNGFFCPCHGSHYDISGRIRKGPAPRNLEIPKFSFLDDDNLVIG